MIIIIISSTSNVFVYVKVLYLYAVAACSPVEMYTTRTYYVKSYFLANFRGTGEDNQSGKITHYYCRYMYPRIFRFCCHV